MSSEREGRLKDEFCWQLKRTSCLVVKDVLCVSGSGGAALSRR